MTALLPSEILERAGDLLAKPGAWTQGRMARDENNETIPSLDDRAACFCTLGAIKRVSGSSTGNPALFLRLAIKPKRGASIPEWNDAPTRTQSEVVAAFRKAAALAREAGE